MKLVRFGDIGQEKPGILDAHGNLRDASAVVADWNGATLGDESLARVRAAVADAADMAKLPLVASSPPPRLGAPVGGIGKLVGIGLNYLAHAAEAGLEQPPEPIIFLKATSAVSGPNDDIALPRGSVETDWEVELAVVIGKGGRYIEERDALSHVAGYCIANDVSEREHQLRRGTQWSKGKSADTFAPLGPWLATRDEIADPQCLNLELRLNGEPMQVGNSADMIFPIATLISQVSEYMTWQPGDVMLTGTPPGVGMGMKPPRYLRAGDNLELRIEQLGRQTARVVAN